MPSPLIMRTPFNFMRCEPMLMHRGGPMPSPPGGGPMPSPPDKDNEVDEEGRHHSAYPVLLFSNRELQTSSLLDMRPHSDQHDDELDSDSVRTLGETDKSKSTSEIFGGSADPGFQQRSHAALYCTSLMSTICSMTRDLYQQPPRRCSLLKPVFSEMLNQNGADCSSAPSSTTSSGKLGGISARTSA